MPRAPRIEYGGAFYHVMNRGNQRRRTFFDEEDRKLFLKVLGETCERTGWWVHSYVLMPNHYHLLIETPRANLVRGMQWLNSTYTLRFNRRHRKVGHLFQGRYKALMVEEKDPDYFLAVSDYIHLNLLRAGLVGGANAVERWRNYWNNGTHSASVLGRVEGKRLEWLRWERIFGALGLKDEGAANRQRFREGLESRWMAEAGQERWRVIRRGWCFGSEDFRVRLLDRLERLRGRVKNESWSGEALEESEKKRGERLYRMGFRALREKGFLTQEDWADLPKNDWRKQWLGWWIFSQSRVTLAWVAERVGMGHPSSVSQGCSAIQSHASSNPALQELLHCFKNSKLKD